jgi:hypothetical protein
VSSWATALMPPFLIAALVLCLAGVAKLRSPEPPARALTTAGFAVPPWLVRVAAGLELALGIVSLLAPSRAIAFVLASAFLAFAGLSLQLARAGAACGCFGESGPPASVAGAVLSVGFALGGLLAGLAGPRGIGWVLGRGTGPAAVLVLGIAAGAYATMIAYTELPAAWRAWSAQ